METNMRTKLLLSAIAAATAIAANAYAADTVTSGDLSTVDKWYGNAGGLQGTDRVMYLNSSRTKVGIAYDKDVAERTNMQRGEATHNEIGVSYDADVATRTNMQRATTPADKATAGIEGSKSN
jgi:hypothetical protein